MWAPPAAPQPPPQAEPRSPGARAASPSEDADEAADARRRVLCARPAPNLGPVRDPGFDETDVESGLITAEEYRQYLNG